MRVVVYTAAATVIAANVTLHQSAGGTHSRLAEENLVENIVMKNCSANMKLPKS